MTLKSVIIGRAAAFFGAFALREKRIAKSFLEIISVGKILQAILLCFAENSIIDELENDFSEMKSHLDAPFGKEGFRHRSVLFERKFANSFEQFLTGNMARCRPRRFLLALANGKIESLLDKPIGSFSKTGIFFAN